jgi:CDP-diacylglycerol--serine O-phosphatidyltransferase
MMPNGLTLANLLCGIYAIILSIRGEFGLAPSFIVLGGIADVLDGRVARATGTGSRFGEELDSLVDALSFGFAPALMVYLGLPNRGNWEWLFIFFFTSCAVMRLARFNVEQAGRKKTHFHGLPSPAAGLTLATYYWFAQTPLYNQTVILFTDSKTLASFPWHTILLGLMATLAALMISDVPYPAVPSIGFRNIRQIFASLVVAASVVLLIVRREEFIFPALLAYVLYGVLKWLFIGFLGRASTPDEVYWEKEAELHRPREDRTAFDPSMLDDEVADLSDDGEDEDADVVPIATSRDSRAGRRSVRRERSAQQPRENREPRESRESREPREPRENREAREPRENREAREPRESRETREPREPREPRENGEPPEPRESREPRDVQEPDEIVAADSNDSSIEQPRAEEGTAPVKRRRRRRGGGSRGNRSPGATPPGPTLPDTPTGPAE